MTAVRRIYLYLVTFASLAALAVGTANLLRALLEAWVSTASATSPGYLQDQVSLWGAAALVGLPVWWVHWSWARRLERDVAERASSLRRLFLYAVLAGSTIVVWVTLDEVLSGIVMAIVGELATPLRLIVPPLPLIAVGSGVWIYHWRVAAADRAAAGEFGPSATLRRWYLYGFALCGLLALLLGAQMFLMHAWELMSGSGISRGVGVSGASTAILGLLVWELHVAWLPGMLDTRSRLDDQRSIL